MNYIKLCIIYCVGQTLILHSQAPRSALEFDDGELVIINMQSGRKTPCIAANKLPSKPSTPEPLEQLNTACQEENSPTNQQERSAHSAPPATLVAPLNIVPFSDENLPPITRQVTPKSPFFVPPSPAAAAFSFGRMLALPKQAQLSDQTQLATIEIQSPSQSKRSDTKKYHWSLFCCCKKQ